jgi:hypothetical protein
MYCVSTSPLLGNMRDGNETGEAGLLLQRRVRVQLLKGRDVKTKTSDHGSAPVIEVIR